MSVRIVLEGHLNALADVRSRTIYLDVFGQVRFADNTDWTGVSWSVEHEEDGIS